MTSEPQIQLNECVFSRSNRAFGVLKATTNAPGFVLKKFKYPKAILKTKKKYSKNAISKNRKDKY